MFMKNQFIKRHSLLVLLYGFLFLGMLGCQKMDIKLNTPNDYARPAGEFIQNNFEFSLFAAAIREAGLVEKLNEAGPYTILAPTNTAFQQLGIRQASDFKKYSKEELRDIVERHILAGRIAKEDIPEHSMENLYYSINNTRLWVSRNNRWGEDRGFSICGSHVSPQNANVFMANGFLHEINKVLKVSEKSYLEWLEEQDDYKIFLAGLKKFGIIDRIKSLPEFTIFAPKDKVFQKHGITLESLDKMDTNRYGSRLFGAYVFGLKFFTTDLNFFPSTSFEFGYSYYRAAYRSVIYGNEFFSNGINHDGKDRYQFFVIETYPFEKEIPFRLIPFNVVLAMTDYSFPNAVMHEIDELIFLPNETLQ